MTRTKRAPVTRAVLALREKGVSFMHHLYAYEARGGTRASAQALGVAEHAVIKTLVFEDANATPFIVLMHGDRAVSSKAMARALGVKTVRPCRPDVAERHTGYKVGGTSPFGMRKPFAVYAQRTIKDLPQLYINGGSRGFLVSLSPADLERALTLQFVDVAVSKA